MRAFQKANRMVDQLTNYDKLTGLPRFNKFKQTVTEIVEGSYEKYALVYCDVNNFKYINEKYGSFVFLGEILSTVKPEVLGFDGKIAEPAYCPHCGAKMDGERSENG